MSYYSGSIDKIFNLLIGSMTDHHLLEDTFKIYDSFFCRRLAIDDDDGFRLMMMLLRFKFLRFSFVEIIMGRCTFLSLFYFFLK